MADLVFSDAATQLIIRLSDQALAYAPGSGKGWQCPLTAIGWTTARVTPRGVQEVELHAANGRGTVVIPQFEQIDRFYVALVRQLIARPFFDPVRESLPSSVPLEERALWLAAQCTPADGTWEALRVDEDAALVLTERGLLIMPGPGSPLERIAWGELIGFRCRELSSRFYRPDSYVEVALPYLDEEIVDRCTLRLAERGGAAGAAYQVPGVRCADADLAMSFSWEIERARDDALLHAEETVVACAVGLGEGCLTPGAPLTAADLVADDSQAAAFDESAGPVRVELLLTDRRLLQVDRDPATCRLMGKAELGLDTLPVVRRADTSLMVGDLEIETETGPPADMAGEFIRRYRRLAGELLDPFSPDPSLLAPPVEALPLAERRTALRQLHRLGFLTDGEYEAQSQALS